jgi:hypothetical protein
LVDTILAAAAGGFKMGLPDAYKAAAEQFKNLDRWGCLLRYISDRIAPVIGPPKPPPALPATG